MFGRRGENMKCGRYGEETRMQVQATISAPSTMYANLSKINLRKKEVSLLSVNWETADIICTCGYVVNGHGNYVTRLEADVARLKAELDYLKELKKKGV